MKSLTASDIKWIVRRLPKALKMELEKKENQKRYIIGGGFIRAVIAKEHINDIDIFAKTKQDAEFLANNLQPNRTKQFVSDNAYSFTVGGKSIQVIHRWTFDNPMEMMNHFDFTIAQCCIYYDNPWFGMVADTFYEDLAYKRLVYTFPDEANAQPGGSFLRLLKFRGRNYNPTLETIAEVVGRMTKANPRDVLRTLVEVDPSSVDATAIAEEPAVVDGE